MPQDSFRSVVYRSFVTCDDPKGVVECKPIRKSKSSSQKMKEKIKNQSIEHDSNTSSSYEEERKDCEGSTEELQNLSSFQLMEVSKGANKLNEVIDSWSNEKSYDPRSKYIAKDLLKGALDLQESLVMLGKLQEASRHIAKSKKKQKERSVGERVDLGTELMRLNQFGDYDQAMDFQKPRSSVGSSSRDCYEELREIIRESFARQNLLPKEKDFVERNSVDFCMDVPSSSSSQSSLIYSRSSDCSPSKIQHEKPKGPNLIAKLMGLEEVTTKRVNSTIYKQMENEKLSRHLLDIDLPRPRKPQIMVQKPAQQRRTLEETIETMQFKGLLEKALVHGSVDGKNYCDISYLRKRLAVENPPIVIMRPQQVLERRAKELHSKYYINEEIPVQNKRVPRKTREEFTEINEKLPAGRTPNQKLNRDKEGKSYGELPVRMLKKTTDIQDKPSSEKMKHLKPPSTKVQKKEPIVKTTDNVSRMPSNTRKKAEIKVSKPQESTKTQDPLKSTVLKHSKPGRGPNDSKCQNVQGKVTVTDKHVTSPNYLKSSIPKKKLKKDKDESKHLANLVESIPSGDNLSIDLAKDAEVSLMKSTTSEQVHVEVTNASHNPISDCSRHVPSYPCESSELTIKEGVKYIDDESCIEIHNLDEMKDCKSITSTKYLLLQSASFLGLVNKLFDDVKSSPTTWLPCHELPNSFLLLECAKEILERKSLRDTREIYPLSQNLFKKPKCHLSLDQLIHEISDGIEDLISYSNIILVDSVSAMLERDLRRKGEVTGAWDLGWRYGFTMDEVDQVVNDLEKLFLSEIVDDVVTEFILW
ncbi:hypothetical protein ACJIZ3_024469 [Penstemon smallii]|uniref:DUF4378 domain-containing protein n=1 Tax=Penstemon smallii TaxID=265156 RepID=A0ABD3TUF9_9LAMI